MLLGWFDMELFCYGVRFACIAIWLVGWVWLIWCLCLLFRARLRLSLLLLCLGYVVHHWISGVWDVVGAGMDWWCWALRLCVGLSWSAWAGCLLVRLLVAFVGGLLFWMRICCVWLV